MSVPYLGQIQIWANNYAPRGWAYCDGQLIPISENQALFAVISDIYGGDARTTLGLPNLQGRFPLHVGGTSGTGPGLTPHRIGERSGTPLVALTSSEMPRHDHGEIAGQKEPKLSVTGTPDHTTLVGFRRDSTVPAAYLAYQSAEGTDTMANEAVSYAGNSESHENRQPYISLGFCIALEGVFPPRS